MDVIGKIQIEMVRTILHILCYKLCGCNIKKMIYEGVLMYKIYCHLEHFINSQKFVLKKIFLQCPEFRNQFYDRIYKILNKLHLAKILETILGDILTIGNNVRICAGAIIAGNITICVGVTVYKDVPSNSVVVPNRSRVIHGGQNI